jgi:uncharacterized protein YciI
MNTILEALYVLHANQPHADEQALTRITLNKIYEVRETHLAWLQKEYSSEKAGA